MLQLTIVVAESTWCRKICKVHALQRYIEIFKHEIELLRQTNVKKTGKFVRWRNTISINDERPRNRKRKPIWWQFCLQIGRPNRWTSFQHFGLIPIYSPEDPLHRPGRFARLASKSVGEQTGASI